MCFLGNIFISYSLGIDECNYSGDEGFDENDILGLRKRILFYKIGILEFIFRLV